MSRSDTFVRRLVATVVGLTAFTATFWFGTTLDSAISADSPSRPRHLTPAPVAPSAMPSHVILLPAIAKPPEVTGIRTGLRPVFVADRSALQGGVVFEHFGLPFAVRRVGPDFSRILLEESAYSIYREARTGDRRKPFLDLLLAAHPCATPAVCRADHTEFDRRWTSRFDVPIPTRRTDPSTWYAELRTPTLFTAMMTHIYRSPATGHWWLIAAAARTAEPGMASYARSTINDVRTQTT